MPQDLLDIAIVTHNYLPHLGGVEVTAAKHAELLASRGHRVTVYTSALPKGYDENEYAVPRGVRVERHTPLVRIKNMPFDPSLAILKRHDVVHAHLPYAFGAELLAIRTRIARIPLVVSFHSGENGGSLKRLLAGPSVSAIGDFYIRYLSARAVGHARKICLVSHDQADHRTSPLRRLLSRFPEKRAFVPYGVDLSIFFPPPERTRVSAFRLVWCGRLDAPSAEYKRPDLALDLVRALGPGVHLNVLGDGELRGRWEARAVQLGITDQVTFSGRLTQMGLAEAYRSADCLISTSVSSEGRPLSILEAMATAMPVIVPNITGLGSLIRNEETGLLYPAREIPALVERVRQLESMPSLASLIGSNAAQTIQNNFSWEASVDRLESALFEAAGG